LEGQIAINTLLARTREMRLAVDKSKLRWRSALVLRGLKALPVTFSTAAPRATQGAHAERVA
jgi:cytochrome P450